MRIGLLGAARITYAALIEPSKRLPHLVLQGIAARDRERAQSFAHENGVVRVFDNYEALVTSPDIDIVYNALPINLHAGWSIKALQAGKHVLCEKPLAMNSEQVEQMLDTAESAGVRLIEAFHYRYHPAFDLFLDWISNKTIGEIKSISAHFNVGIVDDGSEIRHRPELGGGAMMDLGCYPVNWALSITEVAPISITADALLTDSGVDESMSVEMQFPNNVEARISASMAANEPMSSAIRIVGENGEIYFDNPLHPHKGAKLSVSTSNRTEVAPIDQTSTYAHQLKTVANALKSGFHLPTEGRQLLIQQQTLDAIYASANLTHLRHR